MQIFKITDEKKQMSLKKAYQLEHQVKPHHHNTNNQSGSHEVENWPTMKTTTDEKLRTEGSYQQDIRQKTGFNGAEAKWYLRSLKNGPNLKENLKKDQA